MNGLTLNWSKKSFSGHDVFHIVCPEYGTVGVVEGTIDSNDDFYISWLYIEPFFRLRGGISILMKLLKKEIPLKNISKITYDCPKRKKENPHVGSSFDDFIEEQENL